MANETFFVPEYKCRFSKEEDDRYWETTLVPISGTMHNRWIVFYDRSMRLWKVLHPRINQYLTRAETKNAAIAIAKVVDVDLFSEIEFREPLARAEAASWKSIRDDLLSCDEIEPVMRPMSKEVTPSTIWKEKE